MRDCVLAAKNSLAAHDRVTQSNNVSIGSNSVVVVSVFISFLDAANYFVVRL